MGEWRWIMLKTNLGSLILYRVTSVSSENIQCAGYKEHLFCWIKSWSKRSNFYRLLRTTKSFQTRQSQNQIKPFNWDTSPWKDKNYHTYCLNSIECPLIGGFFFILGVVFRKCCHLVVLIRDVLVDFFSN